MFSLVTNCHELVLSLCYLKFSNKVKMYIYIFTKYRKTVSQCASDRYFWDELIKLMVFKVIIYFWIVIFYKFLLFWCRNISFSGSMLRFWQMMNLIDNWIWVCFVGVPGVIQKYPRHSAFWQRVFIWPCKKVMFLNDFTILLFTFFILIIRENSRRFFGILT